MRLHGDAALSAKLAQHPEQYRSGEGLPKWLIPSPADCIHAKWSPPDYERVRYPEP